MSPVMKGRLLEALSRLPFFILGMAAGVAIGRAIS